MATVDKLYQVKRAIYDQHSDKPETIPANSYVRFTNGVRAGEAVKAKLVEEVELPEDFDESQVKYTFEGR